jgi:hypothetical protein
MKPQVKEKWLNALRSGEYQQGKHSLRVENNFCCLGVLTDLYVQENSDGCWVEAGHNYGFRDNHRDDNFYDMEYLPEMVVNWAGLEDENPTVRIADSYYEVISNLNDTDYTFARIADIIEEQL